MKRQVLVVEDEDHLRRILELQLLDAIAVEKASTAEEALPLIDRGRSDTDGFQVAWNDRT